MSVELKNEIEELKSEINTLKRKQRLSEQALKQNSVISKRYDETLSLLQEKEHFTSTIIESNKNAIIAIDKNQLVIIFNKSAEEMFGFSKQEMLNKNSLHKIIPDHLLSKHKQATVSFMQSKKSTGVLNSNVELEAKHKNGTIFPVRIGFGLEIKEDDITIIANIIDITNEKKAQNDLKKSNAELEEKVKNRTKELNEQYEYLQTVIDGVSEPIMVISEDYSITLMNKRVKDRMNTKFVADIQNPKCYEVSHQRSSPCDCSEHPCPLVEVLNTNEETSVIHDHSDIDGSKHFVELSASPLFDKKNRCIGIIESARDITAHLEVQDELRVQKDILHHQAHHDALTGLANRFLFNDRLEHGILQAKRNKSKLALLFIDLDHFKEINDSLGHSVGDKVLNTISNRLGSCIRKKDSLARLGGDEFTIILEDLHNAQEASRLAKKIIDTMVKPITIESNTFYVSNSIGISIYPDDGTSAQDLLKYADSAMYKAKNEGRNNFQYYSSEMTDLALERVQMESYLRTSITNEDFIVYYQPQVDGINNKLVGMEALVRWEHPEMGFICPAKFIPLAESTGLIVELDRLVMKIAMTQISKWYKQGFNPGILAMNLSIKQLQKIDFISVFKKLMKDTRCKPQWIELEVTESQIMTNPEQAIDILSQLNNLGIRLAIDDFGTGYSSLSYLKQLPINKLKIDKSFIDNLPNDEADTQIVNAIIALAQSLHLDVISEGVETKEQKNFIVSHGCKNIQGYFYSKPVSSSKIENILVKGFNENAL